MEYFFILTIQSSWQHRPTAQCTVKGTLSSHDYRDRQQILDKLMIKALVAWQDKYRSSSSEDFSIVFFSLEPNRMP